MISAYNNSSGADPYRNSFAQWTNLSSTIGRISKAFNFIGRDPGPKSINIDLSQDSRNLVFSAGEGSVGRALLDTTLIFSSGPNYTSENSASANTHYNLSDPSTTNARLHVYKGPGYKGSERVDVLI